MVLKSETASVVFQNLGQLTTRRAHQDHKITEKHPCSRRLVTQYYNRTEFHKLCGPREHDVHGRGEQRVLTSDVRAKVDSDKCVWCGFI